MNDLIIDEVEGRPSGRTNNKSKWSPLYAKVAEQPMDEWKGYVIPSNELFNARVAVHTYSYRHWDFRCQTTHDNQFAPEGFVTFWIRKYMPVETKESSNE